MIILKPLSIDWSVAGAKIPAAAFTAPAVGHGRASSDQSTGNRSTPAPLALDPDNNARTARARHARPPPRKAFKQPKRHSTATNATSASAAMSASLLWRTAAPDRLVVIQEHRICPR
eukprot:9377236-Pyramimonas_sp.AAC.1